MTGGRSEKLLHINYNVSVLHDEQQSWRVSAQLDECIFLCYWGLNLVMFS